MEQIVLMYIWLSVMFTVKKKEHIFLFLNMIDVTLLWHTGCWFTTTLWFDQCLTYELAMTWLGRQPASQPEGNLEWKAAIGEEYVITTV
jgi:hypothetical protein